MRFDLYTLLARISPIVVLLLPAAVAITAWVPGGISLVGILTSASGTIAVSFLAAQVGRDGGYLVQSKLWESWGGAPTTQALRHRGPTNPHLLERYHAKLATLLGKSFPSKAQEAATPQDADRIYEAAIALLRERTRDSKTYPLVFKELVNYGFRRNLYGCRSAGVLLSATAFIAAGLAAIFHQTPSTWGLAAIAAVFLVFWSLRVTSEWVKIPAFAYARAILETSDRM